jgi:uncharacterized membrane protein YfhO
MKTNNKHLADSGELKPILKNNSDLLYFLKGKELFIASILISIVAFFVFKDFLLLKKVLLYKDVGDDTLTTFYPLLTNTSNYIHSCGLPSWSFNSGMGQNIFPFFLRDPFSVFLYAFDKNNLVYGIGYLEFSKVIIAGLFFFLYLRTIELKGIVCIIGALLFSFTGFMIVGGGRYIFSSEAVFAALLLLAFEKSYKYNAWLWFPIPIVFIALSMSFNLYLYGLFISVYACFRVFEDSDKTTFKPILTLLLKMFLYGLLGVAISSFFLFENIWQLIESPRGSRNDSLFQTLYSAPMFEFGNFSHNLTAVMRLFSSDILGDGTNYKGWFDYQEAPTFYSGLICLLLLPQAFPFLNTRKKTIYFSFILIWILPVIFPYFRHAFWLFSVEYYRTLSLIISFVFIFISMKALNYILIFNKINLQILIATVLVLTCILFFPYFKKGEFNPIDGRIMSFVKIVLLIYALLIYLLTKKKSIQVILALLLFGVCFELAYLSHISVNKRVLVSTKELNKKEGYNDYSVEALNFIKQRDKGFYRIDKNYSSSPTYHKSLNDGLAQDYYGTSSYNSFNQKQYITFLEALGIIKKGNEPESRWANGLRGRSLRESIGTVKYYLVKNKTNPELETAYDSIAMFGNVKVFKNNYFLPLGFTYDHFIKRSEFDKLSFDQKDLTMLKAFFINDDELKMYSGLTQFNLSDTLPMENFSWEYCRKNVNELKKDTFNIIEKGQDFFNGSISLEKRKVVFLSIPYDKGWTAIVDNKEQELKIVDAGMSALLLDKGKHIIELKFTPRFLKIGLVISLASLLLYLFLFSRAKKQRITLPESISI